ncbi:unnamed protein product [Sphagnum tenellum]
MSEFADSVQIRVWQIQIGILGVRHVDLRVPVGGGCAKKKKKRACLLVVSRFSLAQENICITRDELSRVLPHHHLRTFTPDVGEHDKKSDCCCAVAIQKEHVEFVQTRRVLCSVRTHYHPTCVSQQVEAGALATPPLTIQRRIPGNQALQSQ